MPAALYSAHVTGSAGSNVILFYLDDETIAGIDIATGKYRGAVQRIGGGLRGTLSLTLQAGQALINGGVAPANMSPIPIQIDLPPGFDDGSKVVLIETPLGPVNARFEKLMDI